MNLSEIIFSTSLALVLIWFGMYKFTPTEAEAIVDLVKNNFLTSWMYRLLSRQQTSAVIGIIEIVAGLCLVAGLFFPIAKMLGSGISVAIFFTTSTFLITTPGAFTKVDGLWVPSDTGGFIIKDLIALGVSIYLFSSSLPQLP